ncbi:hypothetical protein [Streptomyces xylophagus]|nr:hypothetical protein [Streptomyces xylophagus]
MRRYQKRLVSLERRPLSEQIGDTVMVTLVQVTVTLSLNALVTAVLSWAG